MFAKVHYRVPYCSYKWKGNFGQKQYFKRKIHSRSNRHNNWRRFNKAVINKYVLFCPPLWWKVERMIQSKWRVNHSIRYTSITKTKPWDSQSCKSCSYVTPPPLFYMVSLTPTGRFTSNLPFFPEIYMNRDVGCLLTRQRSTAIHWTLFK